MFNIVLLRKKYYFTDWIWTVDHDFGSDRSANCATAVPNVFAPSSKIALNIGFVIMDDRKRN